MASIKSRWDNEEEDTALEAQRQKEKEAKKKAKAERQRKLEQDARERELKASAENDQANGFDNKNGGDSQRPSKRRRLSHEPEQESPGITTGSHHQQQPPAALERTVLHFPAPEWGPCRHVDNFEKLNHIEEGSYGWVSRAKETATGEIVALKKLKMDNLNDGFPVTGLREIQTLMASRHGNIVKLREVVMGDKLEDVFLVMDFLEHDLKTLQEEMLEPFLPSETKTLLQQLTSAVEYLHANWILHRDLKTSNLLMNNRGQIKVADFGMARYYGDPPPKLTQLVVTLWYRAPELLLGAETYGAEIDLWSVGCIFGELLTKEALFQGKNEVDQLAKIFTTTTPPTTKTWPAFPSLPHARALRLPANPSTPTNPNASFNNLRARFPLLTSTGCSLLTSLLSLNPANRPTASEVLSHAYFREDPRPKSELMFPTFPSKAGMEKRRRGWSPSAPMRGEAPRLEGGDLGGIFGGAGAEEVGGGFRLRLV